ncbi:MAG: hypothetical protein Fur0025_01960 [Oscillatoriaceae cyanobacterium]
MALNLLDLFDADYYLEQNPDIATFVGQNTTKALNEFLNAGQFDGRDPHPLFETAFYLEQNPDLTAALADNKQPSTWLHFLNFGQFESRDPSSLFNTQFYLANNPQVGELIASGQFDSAFEHFLKLGQFQGLDPSPLFNSQFYLEQNPDVKTAIDEGQYTSAFEHYLKAGRSEGRLGAAAALLGFSNSEFQVIEDGNPVVAVTVTRTDENAPFGEASATIALTNGTAISPEDYNGESKIEVKFAPGETEKSVILNIVDDNLLEGNETIDLALVDPKGSAKISEQNTATVEILDNDGSAVISRIPGTILSDDAIDVFLPPGGEIDLEVTITVPGDGSTPEVVRVSPALGGLSNNLLSKAVPVSPDPSLANFSALSAGSGPQPLPLDIFLLQDLSFSFADDLSTLRTLVPNLARELNQRPGTQFGVGSFIDKPISGFGKFDDYVYQLEQKLEANSDQWQSTVENLTIGDGDDDPEAQLEALLQVALRTISGNENGFREGARRVVVISTDNEYHQAGDGLEAGLTIPNNGDTVIDFAEDYPSLEQVRSALIAADILPVFAVTQDQINTYQNLVDRWGFGKVVQLESDSRNLVGAVTEGLGAVGSEINIFAVDDDFGRIKEILPAKFTGVVEGQELTFLVKLKNDGTGGNDNVTLRALGYGDTKVNIRTIDPNPPVTFVDSETDAKIKEGISRTKTGIEVGASTAVAVGSQFFGPIGSLAVDFVTNFSTDRLDEGANKLPYGELPDDLGIAQENKRELNLIPVLPAQGLTPKNPGDTRNTWVIIHGWNDNPDDKPDINRKDGNSPGDFADIAEVMSNANPGDRVLLLDWRQAAAGGKLNSQDNNPNALLRLGNYTAAKWIRPVAEYTVKVLETFGITAEKAKTHLNLIGHSLGSLVANEIGRIYKEGYQDDKGREQIAANGTGVKGIIALDPPSQTNLSSFSGFIEGIGYDVDGRTAIADFVDEAEGIYLPKFKDFAEFSRAFVGSKSLAGNQLFAEQAHESFQMDFGGAAVDPGSEHTWVVEAFKRMLEDTSLGEIGKLVKPEPWDQLFPSDADKFSENAYTNAIGGKHDGSLAVDRLDTSKPELPKPLSLIFTNKSGEKDDIVYGTAGDDNLNSSDIPGNPLSGDSRYSAEGNDIFRAGEGNDKVRGGSGNDTIYGNQGEDNINGEQDSDLIYGGQENDSIHGGRGDDTIYGDNGDDTLKGDRGSDTLLGGIGADRMWGGGDNSADYLDGGSEDDTLTGESGNDTLIGGNNDDILEGNDNDDFLIGGQGKDTLKGGFGSDTFVFSRGDGATSRDNADIIEDFGNGLLGTGGVDRIALAGDLKATMIQIETFGGFLGIGQKTAIKTDGGEYLAILNGDFNREQLGIIDGIDWPKFS